jgi:hypothetical protein
VVVDEGQHADALARQRRHSSFTFTAEQVAHELAAIAIAPAGGQPV